MRFCTTHRACESAEHGDFCPIGWDCTLVDALIVTKEDGDWPKDVLETMQSAFFDTERHYPQGTRGKLAACLRATLDALERAEP